MSTCTTSAMPADPHSKQFFFINKSESSTHLSQSLASEKAAIQRHVQTGRKRSRKSAARLTQSRSRSASSTPEVAAEQSRTFSIKARAAHGHIAQADSYQHPQFAEESDDLGLDLGQKDLAGKVQWHLTSPAFHNILGKRDPFNASSVPIDVRVAGLIHYYMYYYHPSQWPNEMALLQKGVYTFQKAVLDIMQAAITDKLVMYCLLASSACRLQFVDRLPCPPVVGSEIHYMRKALQLMSSHITSADLEDPNQLRQLLHSIGFLGSAEAYRGNIEGCKTHFDAQIRILELAGGISAIADEHMRGHLAMADLFLACVYLRPCNFHPWYDPGPASSLFLSDHELDHTCLSSTAMELLTRSDDLVSHDLREIISNLAESHSIKRQIITSAMSPERALQVTHWITLRNMAIRNNLLSLEISDSRCHCLRIALIMWSLLAMNVTGRAKTVKVMASKLYSIMSDVAPQTWTEYEDVKLWIVLVGLYCVDEESDEVAGFMSEFARLKTWAGLLQSSTSTVIAQVNDLETFQLGYFFDSRTQRTRTHILVRRIHDVFN